MTGAVASAECQQLLDRLDAVEEDEQRAQIIAEHVATCPQCAAAEAAIATLVAHLREEEPAALAPDRERRLVDFLCTLAQFHESTP